MEDKSASTLLPRTVSLSSNEDAAKSLKRSPSSVLEATKENEVVDLTSTDEEETTVDLTADADGEQETKVEAVRRSGRAVKSTIVYINGQPVLAKNNYRLKGGSYHYGEADSIEKKRPARKIKATTSKSVPIKKKPRTLTTAERTRLEHNTTVKGRVAAKKPLRDVFLAQNYKVLEPFLDARVAGYWKHRAKKVDSDKKLEAQELYIQPEAIKADMRDYQLAGLNWMVKMHKSNLGMILGDEMGLGKTLQTISLLCYLKECGEGISGPSLVICPLSVLYSWCNELKRWAPSLKFLRLHSSSLEEREAQKKAFVERAHEYDVVITTYEMSKAAGLKSLWARQHFNYLVLDEAQRTKDAANQISQAVRLIHSENKLLLSGTPLQNNLVELWSLLNFLYPEVFVSSDPFASAFDLTENVINKKTLVQAHSLLELFMLRRLKTEVEKLMPKKLETKVICPLSNTQVWWYKSLLMKDIKLLARSSENLNTGSYQILNNLVMQLRKCCLHPFLFEGAEVDPSSTTCEELIAASGKLAVLDKLLRSLYEKKHRVVLFSQFTSLLDILDDYCRMRGFNYVRFDGSTARAKRNYIVNQFNAPGSDKFIFLMSTRSGGIGLNLQTADTCILYDSDWNPQPDLQAMARVHRIGQEKTVHVYRLVCGGTIEERMVERAEKKMYMDQMVIQDTADTQEIRVSKGETLEALKFGCNAVFAADASEQNSLPTDEDIEVITDRSRTEDFSDGKLKGGVTNTAAEFKADNDLTATTKLGGIDFRSIRDEYQKKMNAPQDIYGITDMWAKLQKRNRKSRVVNVEASRSGYGSTSVPVLAANNYDFEDGGLSVFQRELGGKKGNFGEVKKNALKSGVDFESQDFCQVCYDGGTLLCCPRCPITVHAHCVGVHEKEFLSCPHHRCVKCNKNAGNAGGLLFACQSCPLSFCEDCLPSQEAGFRILGSCDRMEDLGFQSNRIAYIHCSDTCEQWAKKELGWTLPSKKRAPTPAAWDVSYAFGSEIDANVGLSEAAAGETRPRRGKKVPNRPETITID